MAAEVAPPRRLVPAVDRAVRILQALAERREGLTLSEIATALGAGKSSTHDLLATLNHHGMVERDAATRRYNLGPLLWSLVRQGDGLADRAAAAHALLAELAATAGETVLLAAWSDRRLTVVDRVASASDLRITASIGQVLHPLTGSFGMVLAAYGQLPANAGWPGQRTWTSAERLASAAAEVRSTGVAVDDEEYLEGVWGAAAPILDPPRRLVGAVAVISLKSRRAERDLAVVVPAVRRAAGQIGSLMAGHPLAEIRGMATTDGSTG